VRHRRCAKSGSRVPFSAGVPLRNCAHSAPQSNPSAEGNPRRERSERPRVTVQRCRGGSKGGVLPLALVRRRDLLDLGSNSVAQPVRPKPLVGRGRLALLFQDRRAGRERWSRQEPSGGVHGCQSEPVSQRDAVLIDRLWHPPERSLQLAARLVGALSSAVAALHLIPKR